MRISGSGLDSQCVSIRSISGPTSATLRKITGITSAASWPAPKPCSTSSFGSTRGGMTWVTIQWVNVTLMIIAGVSDRTSPAAQAATPASYDASNSVGTAIAATPKPVSAPA